MEFITVEQFQEQPKEVQKVFIDWWKPQEFDIYAYKEDLKPRRVTETDIEDIYNNEVYNVKSGFAIPLFTEGQLRRFIEDKTDGIVKLVQWHIHDSQVSKRGYAIDILRKNEYHVTYHYKDLGEDLLQEYWKVACMIAEELVN